MARGRKKVIKCKKVFSILANDDVMLFLRSLNNVNGVVIELVKESDDFKRFKALKDLEKDKDIPSLFD